MSFGRTPENERQPADAIAPLALLVGMVAAAALAGPLDVASGALLIWCYQFFLPAMAAPVAIQLLRDPFVRMSIRTLWQERPALLVLIMLQTSAIFAGGLLMAGWILSAGSP